MGTALSKFGLTAPADEDGSQSAQLPQTRSAGDIIATKVNQHYDEISGALNPIQLMPLLLKEELLGSSEESILLADSRSTSEKSCYILQCLEARGPTAYTKFLNCIKAERNHMGHEYVASLLEEKPLGSQFELELSSRLREAIQSHCPDMMDISLQPLVPLMYSKKLLTGDEIEKLRNGYKTEHERVLLLLQLLNTKGPLAHGLFAECLRSESSHPTHNELYITLMSSCHAEQAASPGERKCTVDDGTLLALDLPLFRRWKLQGALKGKTYNDLMHEFQSCNHNGDWKRLEIEAAKYVQCPVPEYKVVAYLEKAISWIFRRKPEFVLQLVGEAKQIIKAEIHGENHSILLGRSEYILSRLFRYLKSYKKAREHVANAKEHLYGIEAGEDSAFVHYCDACITVECLGELSTEQDFERVDEIFGRAICDDRSHKSGLGLVAPHSLLRLAQMYLGAKHYSPGVATNHKNIQRARKCLNAVILDSLSKRSRCHYHLMESDLHRNCDRFDRAKESLDLALDISQKCNFELEISSAQTRLQSLPTCQA